MHNYEKKSAITRGLRFFNTILPAVFWGLVIFGFEDAPTAVISILCALIHEGGHLAYLYLFSGAPRGLRAVISGMRISAVRLQSYPERFMTCLSGPLANFIAAAIASLSFLSLGEYSRVFIAMNLATGISNLIPIEGYDGHGMIITLIEASGGRAGAFALIRAVSLFFSLSLCLLSLYFIDRVGAGYWIFAVFFILMLKQLGGGEKK